MAVACIRCGRFQIFHTVLMRGMGSSSAWSREGLRCLNCGSLADIPGGATRPVCDQDGIPPTPAHGSLPPVQQWGWLLFALGKGM